jgi:hypothetical protein
MPRASPDATRKRAAPSSRASRSGRGGVARADHGDQRTAQHGGIAAHRQERRGILDGLETGGIIGLAQRHEAGAEPLRRRDLSLGLVPRAHSQRPRCAAAPGEIGQRGERGAGAAAMIDERAKRARPRYYGKRHKPLPGGRLPAGSLRRLCGVW